MLRVSSRQYALIRAALKKQGIETPDLPTDAGNKRSKYGNQPVTVEGVWFQSGKEAQRWQELRLLQKAGEITDLRRQVVFPLCAPGGKQVSKYIADFVYRDAEGRQVVEDAKSDCTKALRPYRTAKRWMLAQYGIEIQEV
jgi:hypothetical protein